MTKPVAIIDNETCDYCGTCVAVCPTDAIDLWESTVEVIAERCIGCASCVDICPFGVPEVRP